MNKKNPTGAQPNLPAHVPPIRSSSTLMSKRRSTSNAVSVSPPTLLKSLVFHLQELKNEECFSFCLLYAWIVERRSRRKKKFFLSFPFLPSFFLLCACFVVWMNQYLFL